MEVTTKCGLDPGAVWGAWGLAYLQVGKFKEARQKFSKFLKVCCCLFWFVILFLRLFEIERHQFDFYNSHFATSLFVYLSHRSEAKRHKATFAISK